MWTRILWIKTLLSNPKRRPLKETNQMTATSLLQRSPSNPPEGLLPVVVLPGPVFTRNPAAEMRLMLSLAQVHPPTHQMHMLVSTT